MSDTLISIIIPTLNEEDNLLELLPYLRMYSNENTEIIVADACKTNDNTKKVCAEQKVIRVLCDDCSRATQMNKAASVAKGKILYFIHADARPPTSFIEDIRLTLSNNFDFGIFSYKFDSDSPLLKINSIFTRKKGFFAGGGDQSIFMSRDTFISLGMYDTNYCIMEDFKLFHKAKEMGLTYKIVPHDVIISARKYEQNSYIKVNVINLVAFTMYHMGINPQKIKKMYTTLLKIKNTP